VSIGVLGHVVGVLSGCIATLAVHNLDRTELVRDLCAVDDALGVVQQMWSVASATDQ